MQRVALIMVFGLMAALLRCPAQFDAPQTPNPNAGPPPIQSFTGTGSNTTATFQVQGKWGVHWNCQRHLIITVYAADHTVVAGLSGDSGGSFYLANNGTYYLQIDGEAPPSGADQSQPAPTSGLMRTINDPGSGANNNQSPPNNPDDPNGQNRQEALRRFATESYKWNVQVFAFAYSSNGVQPVAATVAPGATNATATPAPPAGKLTADQARAVVLITGDNAVGTGFLVKTAEGTFVVTNLHVIGNNPNLKITTNAGAPVKMLSARGASDRDLAMLAIQDAGYSYLDLATDVSKTAQPGDEVITPGNSQGGGVILNTDGKVLGIGPDRIEFDNPIYHGNSGGPVFHTGSNKVLGVVTEAMKVDLANALDKTSFASRNSAISSSIRYFGLRLDTVPAWVPLDWNRFQAETSFLEQFNHQSRSLDSFLNPPRSGSNDSTTDANLYLQDDKIVAARDNFRQQSAGADGTERLRAYKELLYDLGTIADTDMGDIQKANGFYPFDQPRVKDELDYRNALKDELDYLGNNASNVSNTSTQTGN